MNHEPSSSPAPPTHPGPLGPKARESEGLETYQRVAETVGMLPSMRWRDNLIQAVIVIAGALLGALIGHWTLSGSGLLAGLPSWTGAAVGAVGGAVVACLFSGLVLMLLGWIRALRK